MIFNILYLHETAKFSGAEESLLNLVYFLDKNLFSPIFVLPEDGLFKEKLEKLGIKVYIVNLPRIRYIKGVFSSYKVLLDIAKDNQIHLVHTNSIRTHIYGAFIARKLRLPLIWHERNLIFEEFLDLDRIFSFLPDVIICNSYAVAKRFGRNNKVRVIYNGVDLERFHPNINSELFRKEFKISQNEIAIGLVGRLSIRKQIDKFLKLAKIILEKTEKVKFFVIGEGKYEKRYKNLAKRLKIEDKVIFTGFRKDMPFVYAGLDVLVSLALKEACGRSILEAMASGKPVVAINSGGNTELILDGITGRLVSNNLEEISRMLVELIQDKSKFKEMGIYARKRVEENFEIKDKVRQIESIYNKLLRERPKISVIIITKNEERNIRDCLESVKWADEIVIVDDYSRDKTVEIARGYPQVKIFFRNLDRFGLQKNFALEKATGEWILSLDADERVSESLKEEILEKIKDYRYDGYYLRYANFVLGKYFFESKAGNLRLFKREKAKFNDAFVHERVVLKGKIGSLRNFIYHYSSSTENISNYVDKVLNKYSDYGVEDYLRKKRKIGFLRFMLYFIFHPIFVFFRKFFILGGWRYGFYGYLFSILSSFGYFVTYCKLWERTKK
ncbi:MAG: glycosyltransferase [Candidatus Omnitrophica bacterium]|nr:glycosyltransferase [Candidatus Omnitrophota bacterium]